MTPLLRERLRLLMTVLGLSSAGVLGRVLFPGNAPLPTPAWPMIGAFLTLPPLALAGLCLSQRRRGVRWGAGVGVGLAAAYANFMLLDPQYNQDANIGLGLYLLGGFVPVLGAGALLGALIG